MGAGVGRLSGLRLRLGGRSFLVEVSVMVVVVVREAGVGKRVRTAPVCGVVVEGLFGFFGGVGGAGGHWHCGGCFWRRMVDR